MTVADDADDGLGADIEQAFSSRHPDDGQQQFRFALVTFSFPGNAGSKSDHLARIRHLQCFVGTDEAATERSYPAYQAS